MKIRILGAHNTESRDTKVGGILVDGAVALDCGALTSTLTFDEQLALRAVLITHHHFDHIKDVVLLGATFYHAKAQLRVFTVDSVAEALRYIFNYPGNLYTNFLRRPQDSPTIDLQIIQPMAPFQVGNYTAQAVPVSHSCPAVGFQITGPEGRRLFYTGDTGPGHEACWRKISPHLLVIECTASNRYTQEAKASGHMTPALLREELLVYRQIHRYLPRVVTTHHFSSPGEYEEIVTELAAVSYELGTPITAATEGMEAEI